MRLGLRILQASALLAILLLPTACRLDSTEEASSPQQETTQTAQASEDSTGVAKPSGTGTVVMMGRSVMEGWFQYWGWDWETPVKREGYSLTYASLEEPPGIASSACDHIRSAPEGSIVFFKFCFVDFSGEGGQEGAKQLENKKKWVKEVAKCAADRGSVLIVGNALPKVAAETDSTLVSQHKAFNSWLDEYAEASDGVYVLDLYGTLATSNGALRSGYAVGTDDSHLSPKAYAALDPLLMDVLEDASSK